MNNSAAIIMGVTIGLIILKFMGYVHNWLVPFVPIISIILFFIIFVLSILAASMLNALISLTSKK